MNLRNLIRIFLTLAMFALAILLGLWLWHHYEYAPWTRDGRVRANIVNLAPDVSGLVTEVDVHDNQLVHRDDLLLTIDPLRFQHALSEAEAAVAVRKASLDRSRSEAARRAKLDGVVVSSESRQASGYEAAGADAQYRQAQAQLEIARLNLERASIRAPTDGYVTNLNTFVGDYVSVGRAALALIDSTSFYVYGYFEETKLPLLRLGQLVDIRLLGGGPLLQGHIESLSRGVTDRDNATGQELLSNVNPVFNWVRLAQRVPVRVQIDTVPDGLMLSAGMTCTVIVRPIAPKKSAKESEKKL
ncbi:MAG: Fusaric acid resistance protein fusE [Nevskia sp.]|nr:Fusaric acid resistance protein fusE [Nevskia sp.]